MIGIDNGWDGAILAVAAFVAVVVLVRLMISQRDKIIARFRDDISKEQQRQKLEKRKKKGAKDKAA